MMDKPWRRTRRPQEPAATPDQNRQLAERLMLALDDAVAPAIAEVRRLGRPIPGFRDVFGHARELTPEGVDELTSQLAIRVSDFSSELRREAESILVFDRERLYEPVDAAFGATQSAVNLATRQRRTEGQMIQRGVEASVLKLPAFLYLDMDHRVDEVISPETSWVQFDERLLPVESVVADIEHRARMRKSEIASLIRRGSQPLEPLDATYVNGRLSQISEQFELDVAGDLACIVEDSDELFTQVGQDLVRIDAWLSEQSQSADARLEDALDDIHVAWSERLAEILQTNGRATDGQAVRDHLGFAPRPQRSPLSADVAFLNVVEGEFGPSGL